MSSPLTDLIIFINDVPPVSVTSLMVLVILLVIRTAQSVGSHLECLTQNTVRPGRQRRLQQTFNSCLNQVPMLWKMGLRETESLCIVILHKDGSLSAQEKEVTLFGKTLKGKIN